jgi:hypothetical protein
MDFWIPGLAGEALSSSAMARQAVAALFFGLPLMGRETITVQIRPACTGATGRYG